MKLIVNRVSSLLSTPFPPFPFVPSFVRNFTSTTCLFHVSRHRTCHLNHSPCVVVVTSVEIGRDVAKDAFGSLPLLGSLLSLAIHPNSHEQGALPFSPSVFHRRYFLNVINTQQIKDGLHGKQTDGWSCMRFIQHKECWCQ